MSKLMLILLLFMTKAFMAAGVSSIGGQDSLVFPVEEYNGINYDVRLFCDSKGSPQYYYADIFTPVCDDDICKPVYIKLQWDLLGSYLRYTVPMQQPLTKVDHEEFSAEEYEQLHSILADSNSLLKDYKMDELVASTSETTPGEVDAVTGATKKSLQALTVSGALYTCYTLWHISHGRVVDTIKRITDTMMSSKLLSEFLVSQNHRYQYYALDKVLDSDGIVAKGYEQKVINLIRNPNVFIASRVLKKLSPRYFQSTAQQQWLWETFLTGNYRLKVGVLEKFGELSLKEDIKDLLGTHQHKYNEDIAKRIETLLKKPL
ncbi:hypothetical protein H8S90_05715 [Olivibacter sp. SDN3]|uniref:hypothetical protein n=1 Tax=Olivibacter sp. SDN3 TaxID=2764720 RepID=UPI0016510102|nr:hypothetical protein [Olivibacter sp. SDN3]QNL51083.1 hypothetical protein H8S90_05715 [Olivibacter sp. SDN3]